MTESLVNKNLDLNNLNVHSDFIDTEKIVNISSKDNDLLTTGNLLNVEHTGNANTVKGPIVKISSTTTSTALNSVLKVENLNQTSGNVVEITGTTDKNALNVTKGDTVIQGNLRAAKLFQSPAFSNKSIDNPNDIEETLVKNTFYSSIPQARTMTLPQASSCDIGDFITIIYSQVLIAPASHIYKTHSLDTGFSIGSTATRVGGAVASKLDISNSTDKTLTITGHANGDGGQGTTVKFVNVNKSANGWAVEAITYNQGTGSEGGTIAFS